ncbi:MAG: hypothetical protein M3O90_06495 [Actinomycetota bacterium]|nr:hypothetical protein [Actinomycetota bacterium]
MHSSEIAEQLAGSLALAVARYLQEHPDAVSDAGVWLDREVEARMTQPLESLGEEATERLEALEEWKERAQDEDPSAWETGRVDYLQAQLNLQSARSGSFATASGSLADFLMAVGEQVDVLDEH